MPIFIIYLIKANIALAIFYLAYRLGLRRLTFYTLNRVFLLFGIIFSVTFPAINTGDFFSHHEKLAGSVTYYSPDWQALQQYLHPESFTVWHVVEYVFWAGVVIMAVRFITQLLSLLRIHLRTTNGILFKEKVRLMHDRLNPFSFFKNIYINPALHTENELKNILLHERVHAQGWHSVDIIASELNNIFYWFNPGAWLMKTAIRENLEFITDRKILRSGTDAKTYQYSLLQVSNIPFVAPIANSFNFSHLKQRIMMMNKKKSSRVHLLRYLLLLPVVAAAILIVTNSRGQDQTTENNSLKALSSKTISSPSDTTFALPASPGSSPSYEAFIKKNPSVTYLRWSKLPSGDEKGELLVLLKNGNEKIYNLNIPSDRQQFKKKYGPYPVLPKLTPTKVIFTPPGIKKDTIPAPSGVTGYISQAYLAAKRKDYDKATELAKKALQADPEDREAKHVLDYIQQLRNYRQKIAEYNLKKERAEAYTGRNNKEAALAYQAVKEKNYDKALTLAKSALQTEPDNALAKSVIRYAKQAEAYEKAIEKYRQDHTKTKTRRDTIYFHENKDQGLNPESNYPSAKTIKDTVVPSSPNAFSRPNTDAQPGWPAKPLYILNGKPVNIKQVQTLPHSAIESVSVLKGEAAVSAYGERGDDGVIEIVTKSGRALAKTGKRASDTTPSNTLSFVTVKKKANAAPNDVIYIVNGKKTGKEGVAAITPEEIASIVVYKDSADIIVPGKKKAAE